MSSRLIILQGFLDAFQREGAYHRNSHFKPLEFKGSIYLYVVIQGKDGSKV